jgi:hypothetical protein
MKLRWNNSLLQIDLSTDEINFTGPGIFAVSEFTVIIIVAYNSKGSKENDNVIVIYARR